MFNFIFKRENKIPWWLLTLVIIFFISISLFSLWYYIFNIKYKDKVYPGVFLGQIDLVGATESQAGLLVNTAINNINQKGIIFKFKEEQITIYPIVTAATGDWAYEIITFSPEKTINLAINFGRDGNWLENFKNKLGALTGKKYLSLSYAINTEQILKILKEKFGENIEPAQNAHLVYQNKKFNLEKEKAGIAINYAQALEDLNTKLKTLDSNIIILADSIEEPTIYSKDVLNIETKIEKILKNSPFWLTYKTNKWNVSKEELSSWLALKKDKDNGEIKIGLDKTKTNKYFATFIEPVVNKIPEEAKFKIQNGKVLEFQNSQDGQELNIDASLEKIEEEFIKNENKNIELVISELKSSPINEGADSFGIRELLGNGQSDFSGSPVNRRHNIKVGADSLNGVLINPSEEFSLLKALGKVDKKGGYLQELVIKDNKTIPEFGGGLCQIGTTIFRAAMATGLPITARRNHSYRVVYYEPAGKDAAIYDPWPDVKFINDTKNYILIQSRIEGNNLYFDFWGTSDGRVASQTDSAIYNITKPAPTKIIETLDLKPGVKKCTERAHNGADAYFDYIVTYPDNEIKKQRFSSHYVPWREVCLLGVEKLTENASTTIDNISTSTP